MNVAHTCKEEWLELVVILIAFRCSYRLHCETAFNMDDTAQIEKSRVGKFDLTYMKSCMYLRVLLARKRGAACFAYIYIYLFVYLFTYCVHIDA